jgi:hypothetical protein
MLGDRIFTSRSFFGSFLLGIAGPLGLDGLSPLLDTLSECVQQWQSLLERDTSVGDGDTVLERCGALGRDGLFALVDI